VTQSVDFVVEAMGLEMSENVRAEIAKSPGRLHTAGAMVNGGASVGHCIAEGYAAAEAIHEELSK
jgi:protoporphyrinogen oxidase